MKKLLSTLKEHASISAVWLGLAVAILIPLLVTASTSPMASANTLDRADLGMVHCETDGVHLYWRTENEGRAAAPDGWRVERSHQDSEGTQVVQTFTFIGDEADALQASDQEYWDWIDSSVDQNVLYTYRVRAINADGSDMNGRAWSRNALVPRQCETDG